MTVTCVACRREFAGTGLQCPACLADGREAAPGPPSRPQARQTAANGQTEAEVQAEIVAFLELHGWDVTKTSAHAHARGVTAGTPDLYLRRGTVRVWCEVKRPGGRVSAAQAAWHERERAAGGTVLVAYGVADVEQLTREVAA